MQVYYILLIRNKKMSKNNFLMMEFKKFKTMSKDEV